MVFKSLLLSWRLPHWPARSSASIFTVALASMLLFSCFHSATALDDSVGHVSNVFGAAGNLRRVGLSVKPLTLPRAVLGTEGSGRQLVAGCSAACLIACNSSCTTNLLRSDQCTGPAASRCAPGWIPSSAGQGCVGTLACCAHCSQFSFVLCLCFSCCCGEPECDT